MTPTSIPILVPIHLILEYKTNTLMTQKPLIHIDRVAFDTGSDGERTVTFYARAWFSLSNLWVPVQVTIPKSEVVSDRATKKILAEIVLKERGES